MNFLPKEIEDIILDYKYQLEHQEKFSCCLYQINNMCYSISIRNWYNKYEERFYSKIEMKGKEVHYFVVDNKLVIKRNKYYTQIK